MLRYLKRTTDYTLVYQYDSGEIHLEAWADSDYAGEIDTRKSTSRFCVKVNSSGAVSWPSKLQQTLATSTVEAKTNATSECVKETIHFRGLLAFLAYNQPSATTIWSDNQASIAISGNASFCKSRTIRVGVEGNANSSRSRIDGHGTAEFWVDDSAGRERHLKLKDASYVPSYSHNLVTVSNLNTNGAVATKTRRGSR